MLADFLPQMIPFVLLSVARADGDHGDVNSTLDNPPVWQEIAEIPLIRRRRQLSYEVPQDQQSGVATIVIPIVVIMVFCFCFAVFIGLAVARQHFEDRQLAEEARRRARRQNPAEETLRNETANDPAPATSQPSIVVVDHGHA